MGRGINKLSARFVDTTKEPGRHSDGGGLYLYVEATGARRWRFLFDQDKKRRELGLGSAVTVSLVRAREIRDVLRNALVEGKDPAAVLTAMREGERPRAAVPVGPLFGEMLEDLLTVLAPGWKTHDSNGEEVNKQEAIWRKSFELHAPQLLTMPVAAVDTDTVKGVLEPIWREIHVTASRLRGRIERVIARAKALRKFVGDNPAVYKGHLEHILPVIARNEEHHPAMPYERVPGFLVRLTQIENISRRALELTLLTAVRTYEVIGMKWGEIDFENAVWIVPIARVKGRKGKTKEHRVALGPRAVALLLRLRPIDWRPGDYVFHMGDSSKQLSRNAMLKVLEIMGQDEYTVHGFRTSFKEFCVEETEFDDLLSEAQLAHIKDDEVWLAYNRRDALKRRRALMLKWEQHCESEMEYRYAKSA